MSAGTVSAGSRIALAASKAIVLVSPVARHAHADAIPA
jgi:hypothetical protein